MTEKEVAIEFAKQLGFGDWKYKRGFGGGNHYFCKGGKTLWIPVSKDKHWTASAYAGVEIPEVRRHFRLVVGSSSSADPVSHVIAPLIMRVEVPDHGEFGSEISEALLAAGEKGKAFFERVVDAKSANQEYKLHFDEGENFIEGMKNAQKCVGLNYLTLAIKFEAKDEDLEEFRQNMLDSLPNDSQIKRWNKHYEAGDFDSPHTEAGDTPSEPVVPLMQEHPVGAKAAVCGFVCDQKLSAAQFAKTFGVAVEKVATDVELGESVVDYRNGFEPLEIDCFDFGSGTLFISSNDAVSDLDFEKASQHGKYVTFRAMDTASMYSVELFIDGKSAATRVDNEDRTMRDGKQLLPDCADGAMELFDIFLVVKDEFDADFWQLKTTHKGTRIKVNRE